MNINIIIFLLFILYSLNVSGQTKVGVNTQNPSVTFEVNGKIRVGDDSLASSPAGTIRFNQQTGDFEGFDGNDWVSFTPNPNDQYWPTLGNRGATGSYYDFSPPDAIQGDNFGFSVDIYGNYAVVGSPGWNDGEGRAFVFKREPAFGFWSVMDTLYGFENYAPQSFGYSVAIHGDKIVVGAPYLGNESQAEFGNIFVFKRNGNQWHQGMISGPYNYCKQLGIDVDIFENRIVAGCPELCTTCTNPSFHWGAMYYEVNNNGNFIGLSPLKKNTAATSVSRFGHAVAISGDWIAVSNPISNTAPREDSVYLYKQTSPFNFENLQTFGGFIHDEEFGYSLSMHENKLLIGKRKRDMASPEDERGEAIMYLKDNLGAWGSHVNIAGQDTLGMLGHAVSASATHQIVAGHQDPTGFTTTMQSLKLQGGTYSPYVNITDPQATFFDHKINDVSIQGNYFIVGAGEGLSSSGQNGGRVFFGRIR